MTSQTSDIDYHKIAWYWAFWTMGLLLSGLLVGFGALVVELAFVGLGGVVAVALERGWSQNSGAIPVRCTECNVVASLDDIIDGWGLTCPECGHRSREGEGFEKV